MNLTFSKIEKYLDELCIWGSCSDLFWYKLAWSIIEKNKMNSYDNDKEKILVWIRLLIIVDDYNYFCHLAFGEPYDKYDYELYGLEDEEDYFVLGQLSSESDSGDSLDGIAYLADKHSHELRKSFANHMDVSTIFHYMTVTGFDSIKDNEGNEYAIESYEEYLLSKDHGAFFEDMEFSEAYAWLCDNY